MHKISCVCVWTTKVANIVNLHIFDSAMLLYVIRFSSSASVGGSQAVAIEEMSAHLRVCGANMVEIQR
jgi:hypothetical protein